MAQLREVTPDPQSSAKAAGLVHVSDASPGFSRRRAGKGFAYLDGAGRPIRDDAELARFRKLGIPPAWTSVWICSSPLGHLQATGRDARGRKQYRYHARWRDVRDETKFDRMIAFAKALPTIRRRTERDLRLDGLPREKVLATVVQLLEKALIRVGNEEYARDNESFGLTTMRDGHARIQGGRLKFRFRGKSGKEHEVDVRDRRLARIVKRCQDLPGDELFQYVGADGTEQKITSGDVNDYLRAVSEQDFTAKDFRTWFGTVLAACALDAIARASAEGGNKAVVAAIDEVAARLGNTRAVCRRCYVHPAVIDAYMEGSSLAGTPGRASARKRAAHHLSREESAVLQLLETRARRDRESLASRLQRSGRGGGGRRRPRGRGSRTTHPMAARVPRPNRHRAGSMVV